MLSAGGVAGVRVRACLLAVTAVALLAVLALLLPPLLFRLEDGLHSHVQPATTGARPLTGARPFSFGVAQRGAVELPDLPKAEDAEWLLWRPFTINAEEVKPGVGGGAAAKKPAADRRRGGAWPPGVTEEAGQRAAARISPDVFAALPERFSDGYKAPCWRNATSGGAAPLLCLPHFYILGVFQCGVKDLYERLLMHPDVATTLNGAPHYWDEAVPFSRYLGFFAPAVTAVEAAPERVIFGDASLSTFTYTWTGSERIHLSGWTKAFRACRTDDCDGGKQPCVDETCYAKATATSPPLDGGGAGLSLPFLLRAAHGANVKLMVLLRNPVDRLHAAFWHYEHYGRQYGASEEGFTKYALEMVAAVQGCLAAGLSEALCVTAFEANGPTYEAVFYHADQARIDAMRSRSTHMQRLTRAPSRSTTRCSRACTVCLWKAGWPPFHATTCSCCA